MQRMLIIQQWDSSTIDPLGMPDIKAVDLHAKYIQLAPDSFHDLICPKPADEVIEK